MERGIVQLRYYVFVMAIFAYCAKTSKGMYFVSIFQNRDSQPTKGSHPDVFTFCHSAQNSTEFSSRLSL